MPRWWKGEPRGCIGVCFATGKPKNKYDSSASAYNTAAHRLRRNNGELLLRAYKCPACSCWHLTSKPLKMAERAGVEPASAIGASG